MVAGVLNKLSPVDDIDRVGETVSPHLVGGGGQDDGNPLDSYGGGGVPNRISSSVRIVLAAVSGTIGAWLIVGTSPWGHMAPVAWRLTVPGLVTSGNSSFYAASTFVLGVVLMSLGWLGLVGHMSRGTGSHRQQMRVLIGVGLLWAIPFMLAPIQLSTDAYSYAAQGDLASIGLDPTAVGPNALPNHATNLFWRAADPIWRDSPAPYGPVSIGSAKAIVTLSGFDVTQAVWGFRMLAVAGVLMTGAGVFLIARSRKVSPTLAVALAIANPLVLIHLVGGAHNDALMMGLLTLGMAAFERSRRVLAVVLITFAVCVKLPAVLALAFIAFAWKGRDADFRNRLIGFPIVGAIAAAVTAVLCVVAGIGFGWISAMKSTGTVYSTFSVFTKIGFLASDLLSAVGIDVDHLLVVGIARAVGLLLAGALIVWLLARSPRVGVTKSVGLALLVLVIFGPVIWPWYMPAGFALLAAVGVKRYRPSMIVLIIASSVFVFPTSVNPVEGLSRYQHWLGFGVVLLIAGLCVGAQRLARFTEERRERLLIDGHPLEAVLVGPAPARAVSRASDRL